MNLISISILTAFLTSAPSQFILEHDFSKLLENIPKSEKEVKMEMRPIIFDGAETPGQHNCFWMGPVNAGKFNIAYPDEGAIYWATAFKFPKDIKDGYLEIKGKYPKARYMSIHTYTKGSAPYDHIGDRSIIADEGSQNPFETGKYQADQTYTVKVYPGDKPEDWEPNSIFFGPMDEVDRTPILLRNYIPETDGDMSGGAGLPEVALVLDDGSRIEGKTLCDHIGSPPPKDPKRILYAPMMEQATFDELLEKPSVSKSYLDTKKEAWSVFWDPRINILGLISPPLQAIAKVAAREGFIEKTSGFFANLDNQYVSINLNEKFGEVVMLKARLPRTPKTGADSANASAFDLRYWSLCTNESMVTTRFSACVYDSEIAINQDREYTIVVSKASNRPSNAKTECGITWLDWGNNGDGAGHKNITSLILRNMAPNPDFPHAVQRIAGPGLESETMGAYLPEIVYLSTDKFEELGC